MRKVSAEGRQKEEQMRGESQRRKHMRKVSMLGMQNKEQMREVIKERTKKVSMRERWAPIVTNEPLRDFQINQEPSLG